MILAYEQFESSLAQQMLQMINEWQNKTHKFVISLFAIIAISSSRHKQDNDTFDLAIESFINNMSLADKYDFVSIVTALESKHKQLCE